MVRAPCIDQNGMNKGAWSQEEDNKLRAYVQRYGHWNWRQLPKFAGLNRCGKSCRLRWLNYLKPGVKRGDYTPQEEDLILELHRKYGSKWSVIAAQLPGRVDNDIKNHWHSHLRRKMKLQQPLSSKSTDDDRSSSSINEVDPNYNQESDSLSVSTFNSEIIRNDDQDQMKSDSNNNEVSSLSWDTDSMVLLQDYAANQSDQDSPSSVLMESFWTQPFATSDGTDHHLHDLQLSTFPEEEIMHPFTSDLDEINMDYWLHELMQIP